MSSDRKYRIGYAAGLIMILVGINVAMFFPWIAIFGSEEELVLLRLAMKMSLFALVFIGGLILYRTGSRESRKEYEGKVFESLEVGKEYVIRSSKNINGYTYLHLEPREGEKDIISFRTKIETMTPQRLEVEMAIAEIEGGKIVTVKDF